MVVRKTLQWFLFLVLLVALGGGTYGFWLWNQSDEMLRTTILSAMKEAAPGWDVRIKSARIDWLSRRRIHLYEVEFKPPGQNDSILFLREIVLTVDRELMEETQSIDVSHVRLRGLGVDLVRDVDGKWNWESLPKLPKSDRSLPEIEIEDGTVRIQLAQSDGSDPALITLHQANVNLIPSGKREFVVKGTTQVQEAGVLHFEAEWNVDAKTWMADGSIHDVTTSGELTALAASTSPHLRSRLQQVDAALRKYAGLVAPGEAVADGPSDVPNFGVGGTLNIDFRISRPKSDDDPKFAIGVDIRQGHVTNPALPFPLHDLTGKVSWDNDRLELQQISGRFGATKLLIDGDVEKQQEVTPARFEIHVTDVDLDEKLRNRLTEGLQKIYDSLQPTAGTLDAQVVLEYDGRDSLRYHDLLITAKNCTCKHARFQYPVRGVAGTIKQVDWGLEIHFNALANRRPVNVEGWVKNPGPDAEAKFEIQVDELPLDETFVAACTEQQRKTLRALALRGLVSAHCTVHKPPGAARKHEIQIRADVWDGSLTFERFPWQLDRLSGKVAFDSTTERWTFKDLEARHDMAIVLGQGTFSHPVSGDAGLLELALKADRANLDDSLFRALPTEQLRALWTKLSPTGRVDLTTRIQWIPGSQFAISFPSAKYYEGTLKLEPFPIPLSQAQAQLSYQDGIVKISTFSAKSGGSGVNVGEGLARWAANGDWRIRLEKLHANDLDPAPNGDLRRAFKKDSALRRMIEQLNPHGPLSLSGMMEFHGTTRRPDVVTAAWDLSFVLSQNDLTVGVDLKNVSGKVTARGTVDDKGRVNMVDGNRIDLNHAEVMGFAFSEIHGPYRLKDKQLTVGSPDVFSAEAQGRHGQPALIPRKDHLTAKVVDGELTLDADAVLQNDPSYRMRMTLSHGSLENFARQYTSSASNVRGDMDGWIDLAGRGSSRDNMIGKGQLMITNAALYELPLLVQMFNALSFVPQDKTAFKYAMADFDVKESKFEFRRIDLDGDTIRLLGEGDVRFDGAMHLKFYSMLSRQSRTFLPVVDRMMNEATRGWVGVTVTGNVRSPDIRQQAVPQFDNALRQLLRPFEWRLPGAMPKISAPPFVPYQLMPPTAPTDARRPQTYRQ